MSDFYQNSCIFAAHPKFPKYTAYSFSIYQAFLLVFISKFCRFNRALSCISYFLTLTV
jgi:hypothetical protein